MKRHFGTTLAAALALLAAGCSSVSLGGGYGGWGGSHGGWGGVGVGISLDDLFSGPKDAALPELRSGKAEITGLKLRKVSDAEYRLTGTGGSGGDKALPALVSIPCGDPALSGTPALRFSFLLQPGRGSRVEAVTREIPQGCRPDPSRAALEIQAETASTSSAGDR